MEVSRCAPSACPVGGWIEHAHRNSGVRVLLTAAWSTRQPIPAATGPSPSLNISTECPVASAPYAGPIFDAMTQFDERAPMSSGVAKARAEGIQKMAIFARSRKALEENALETLVLQERASDLLVVGAPKYFLNKGDLGADYTRSTVHALKKHRHPFIGEILFTHADKREGTQNASGERYVDPTAPGVNAFLDAHKDFRWPYYREIIQTFRRYAADLPEEAQRKIAYRNAERLYGVAVDAPSALPAAR